MTAICLSPTDFEGSAWQPGDIWHEGGGERLPSGSSWAEIDPPGKLRLEWREARGDRTTCTYRLEGTKRFFRLELGPDDVHVELQEVRAEALGRPPNGTGLEFATTHACYSFLRWAPGGATPEPARPAPPWDVLTQPEPYDVLHRGTR